MKLKKIMAMIFLLSNCLQVFALDADKDEPLSITAQAMEYDQQTNIGIYIGNVTLDQGSTHLTADKLVIYSTADYKLLKAIATGNPVHYKTIMDAEKPPIFAEAQEMQYLVKEHKIILTGKAKVMQGNDQFTGPHVEYDTEKKLITSNPQPHQKTTLIIQSRDNTIIQTP